MFDPMLTLLVAKAKAVGLVAGTALVTTALVGGGAVAMTAVSHDGEVHEEVSVSQVEATDDADVTEQVTSATPTVGIDDPEVTDGTVDGGTSRPLPEDFTCDETRNHGQNVSAYARSLEKGPGRGAKISAVAQSDCGKSAGEEEVAETEAPEEESAGLDTASTEKPKADKPTKAKKPAKADKPAKAKGKPEGKGGGRG